MRIDNKPSFWAAVLAFVGTVIVVMDSFTPIHRMIDRCPKWKNIRLAMADLDTFDTKIRGGKMNGVVERGNPGFTELVHIIVCNRPDFKGKQIVAVVKNQPMITGGVPLKIVHVVRENNPQAQPLTTDYICQEWVREYREKYFLKVGLSVIAVGFFLSVIAHIKLKDNDATQATHGEATHASRWMRLIIGKTEGRKVKDKEN